LDLLEPDIAGVGELVIRGANVVAGYWRQPEASAAAIVDGWLRTGDMASIDAEGFVTLLDRRKDMINRGGENVYSVEVENALQMHPSVLETAVLAVPDDVMGERVGAVVVCRPGQSVDERALLETASSILARFKLPEYFCIRPTPLPRNPGGKVLKRSLTDVDWRGPVRLASSGGSSRPDRRSHG
jgi:acyl-CoA synthetase (AMP-forming)/AMP-acid ligase II